MRIETKYARGRARSRFWTSWFDLEGWGDAQEFRQEAERAWIETCSRDPDPGLSCTQGMRAHLFGLLLLLAAFPLSAQTPALTASFRVGGQVGFGSQAEPGTHPWAALWTTTRLTNGAKSPLLTTTTEITAAPGSDFDLAATDSFRAMRFDVGIAVPLRASWNFKLYFGGGLKARVFEAGDEGEADTPRWLEAGVYVASTERGWLRITGAADPRSGVRSSRALLIAGAFDVIPGSATVTLCGRARLAGDTRVELAVGVGR